MTGTSRLVFQRIDPSQTIPLRHTVLWPDLDISAVILPEDGDGIHFGAFESADSWPTIDNESIRSTQPISVISFFLEPLIKPEHGRNIQTVNSVAGICFTEARFRKFATSTTHQSLGAGTALLNYAISQIREEWPQISQIWCDARLVTSGWYTKRGMKPVLNPNGDCSIFWKGGVEYVKMEMKV